MKLLIIRFLPLCLAVSGFAILAGCKPEQKKATPVPPKVEIIAVRQGNVPIVREWVGTLDGSSNAAIQAQVTGYLISQEYADGDFVKKGQLLFKLDRAPFLAKAEQAKADVEQNEARVKKNQMDVDRYTPLAKKDAISAQELDDAVQALAGSKAALAASKAASLEAAIQLGYTEITSPIDGFAGISTANIGELISPGRGNLAVVSTINPIRAIFTVSEDQYLEFRTAANMPDNVREKAGKIPFKLILSDGTVFGETGHFDAVNRQVNQYTGSLEMRVVFPNPRALLRPGQFARVSAIIREEKGVMLVPQRAVTELQGNYLVAVVGEDDKVTIKKVEVGECHGLDRIIKSGLKPGEHVVAEGTQKARNGIVVEPVMYVPPAIETKK